MVEQGTPEGLLRQGGAFARLLAEGRICCDHSAADAAILTRLPGMGSPFGAAGCCHSCLWHWPAGNFGLSHRHGGAAAFDCRAAGGYCRRAVFGISRGVFRYLERLVSHSVNFRLLAQYRVWFYRSIEPLAPAGLQSYQSGDILARAVADINTLEHFYVRVVAPPLVALIATVGVCWLVGLAHWGFSLILTAGLLVNGVLIPLAAHFASRTVGAASVAARARLSAVLIQGLQGTADLVAFRQEKSLLAQQASQPGSSRAQTSLAWRGALTNAINLLVSNLTLWGYYCWGFSSRSRPGWTV